MKKFKKKQVLSFIYIMQLILSLFFVVNPSLVQAADNVNLLLASSFGVLAGSTITNTGPTTITGTAGGDIGLYPGTSFTGATSVTQSGTVHLTNAVAQQAISDLQLAYNDAENRDSTNTIAADLAGQTLVAGVYTSASSIDLNGILILDGAQDPSSVFIFQAGTTLTTGSSSSGQLINGAQPCNVFWQVGTSATLGTDSTFVGHIMADQSITATTRALIYGQLLAINGAVTLDTNTIINDACLFGAVQVTKEVVGDVTGVTLPDFIVTLTGPNNYSDTQTIANNESYTWINLPEGTYTIAEAALSDEWEVSGDGEVGVISNTTTQVTLTNTYTPTSTVVYCSLQVTKEVVGDVTGVTLPDFIVTLTGPNNYSDTQTIANNESYTWINLPEGTYTIAEAALSEEWEVSGDGEVGVISNAITQVTLTNTYTKHVTELGTDKEIKIVDTSDGSAWIMYTGLVFLGIGFFILRKWK